jgi:uncharacterized protein with PQ loop repeat
MVFHPHGAHHLHKRIRIYRDYQPYPHTHRWINLVDRSMIVAVVIGLIMTFPQVLLVWTAKTAAGLSLASWVTYLFTNMLWIVYGVVHRDRLIMVSSLLFVLMQFFIVTGIIFYG